MIFFEVKMRTIFAIYITIALFLSSLHAVKPQQFFYDISIFSWSSSQLDPSEFESVSELLKMNRINQIYQSFSENSIVNASASDFIKNMKINNIDTFYLSGDPSWATERRNRSMRAKIDLIYEYNKKVDSNSQFSGIVFDVEPYLLSDWKEDTDRVMEKFLSNMIDTYEYAKQFDISVIICIPYWFDNNYYDILERLISGACDKVAVMNYARNKEIKNIANEVNIAKEYKKQIVCITEIQPPSGTSIPDSITYYNYGLNVIWRMWNQVYSYFDYDDLSFSYHQYKQLKEFINDLENSYKPAQIVKRPHITYDLLHDGKTYISLIK